MMLLAAIVLLALQVNASNFLEFQFDVEPTSVVTFTGERIEYHCIASCIGIFWLINDTIAGVDHNIVVSTRTRPRSDGKAGEESTLWITASIYANNSAIKCYVHDRRIGFEIHSSPAYLTVQGLLSPPKNIQLVLQSEHLVVISWDQPFTLNITNSDNTIRYRVFVHFSGNSAANDSVYNTFMTEFTYNCSANMHFDRKFLPTFQVSAINKVGSSNKSDPVSVLCITEFIQSTSIVREHSSTSSNLVATHTRSTTVVSQDKTLAPKPTITQPEYKNTETGIQIVIIVNIVALSLIILSVITIVLCLTIMKKHLNNNEMNTSCIPTSISLELNVNNAYDLSSHEIPCQHELSVKDKHYSEVEQPEALYAEIPV